MIQILSNVILLAFTLFLYVGLPLISQMVDNIYCIDEDIYPVCTVYVFYFIYYFIIILFHTSQGHLRMDYFIHNANNGIIIIYINSHFSDFRFNCYGYICIFFLYMPVKDILGL